MPAQQMFETKSYTLQEGAEATGNGTVADLKAFYGHLTVQIIGMTSGVITFETSNDGGTTWDARLATNDETGAIGTTASADGTYSLKVLGIRKLRARISTYASGTIYVYGVAVPFSVPDSVAAQLINSSGTELLTAANPGVMQLSGSNVEQASAQDTQLATTAVTYNRAAGASRIEVYCESGYVRVRTDGQPCTSTTGEPIAAGFGAAWNAESISVFYVQESIITVVSR